MSFSTMKTKVLQRARASGTLYTTITGDYLNECSDELTKMAIDWKVLEQQDTSTGVVGQANYATPDNFERMLSVNLESGTNKYRIIGNNYDAIRGELNANTSNGLPSGYAIHYDQLWYNRTLDDTYTMRMDYIKTPSTMSSDSDTSPFPEKLLMQYALAYLKKDMGRFSEFEKEYELYNIELQRFIEAQDRNPDRMDGFSMGLDGVSAYYKSTVDYVTKVSDV